jgi:magnesium chelatase family protein
LPDGVVREAKDRVRCAIENSGFEFPYQEIIVSLAPAALPKFGSDFDLAIALTILASSGQLSVNALKGVVAIGELTLDGSLKAASGALASAELVKSIAGAKLLLPNQNSEQVSVVKNVEAYAACNLQEAVGILAGVVSVPRIKKTNSLNLECGNAPNFSDVIGQYAAKRAIEISAAGGHNLLMVGPPGAGKSMLAMRMTSVMPQLSETEAIEVTKIYSVSTVARNSRESSFRLLSKRPFRSPHHTISAAALIGGGSMPTPGEISLAHKGVLFLDELPEFRRDVIEALRQPIENRAVLVSRAKFRIDFPADFVLLAAMNPCPCGFRGTTRECKCSPMQIQKYKSKLSGPLLDRIDMQIWIPAVPLSELNKPILNDPTIAMRTNVLNCRRLQQGRFRTARKLNSQMTTSEIKNWCKLNTNDLKLLEEVAEKNTFSARAYSRTLRLARTIADLDGAKDIATNHLQEALSYRLK